MCRLEQVHTCHRQHHTHRGVFPASLVASSLSRLLLGKGTCQMSVVCPSTHHALSNEGRRNARGQERERDSKDTRERKRQQRHQREKETAKTSERERDSKDTSKDTSNFRHIYPTQHCLNNTDSAHTHYANAHTTNSWHTGARRR